MSESSSDPKNSITQVAEESFVRERPLDIERGSVLAGRYQIEEIIGKGGSGVVLRVFDRTVQNVVALKVLKTELARDSKWDKRFSRELRLGRPIQHPNVCRIFDIGEADGHRFLTMELATGGSLRDELKRSPALERPLADRLADARSIIDGLAAIHAAGVVHRDFKPDNLLRMQDGRLVISDFGLATDAAVAAGVTVMIGTPHYMAPEVLAGEPATARSDVWALGVVLHEVFWGRRPERKPVSFEGSQVRQPRLATRVERNLLQLCQWCLAESPGDRPASAQVVARELTTISADPPGRRGLFRYVVLAGAALTLFGIAARAILMRAGGRASPALSLRPSGNGVDLADKARVLAELPGHVHCFSLLDGNRARVVWGLPRRAEDIDLASGARSIATLVPEAYQSGCPFLAPGGGRLLFDARTTNGTSEIRLSNSTTGANAAVLTAGSEPIWVNDDRFVYTVDVDHAAVFSIPNMSFEIVTDAELGAEYGIKDKAVSPAGDRIAVLYSDVVQDAVVVYDGRSLNRLTQARVSTTLHLAFGRSGSELLTSGLDDEPTTSLSELDWESRRFVKLASYHGFDLRSAGVSRSDAALLANRIASDAWSEGPPRQLTFDGRAYSAATSVDRDLLVSKRGDDGRINIWWQRAGSPATRVTEGIRDVEPAFAPDGRSWAYADYVRRSIWICATGANLCRVLHTDRLVPTWPSFSPDGRRLVFMTQLKTVRFTVVAVADGQILSSWEGSDRCPPVWNGPDRVSTLEGGMGRYAWSEHEVTTGRRGGQGSTTGASSPDGDVECGGRREGGPAPSPAVAIRSRESSRILMIRNEEVPGLQ